MTDPADFVEQIMRQRVGGFIQLDEVDSDTWNVEHPGSPGWCIPKITDGVYRTEVCWDVIAGDVEDERELDDTVNGIIRVVCTYFEPGTEAERLDACIREMEVVNAERQN